MSILLPKKTTIGLYYNGLVVSDAVILGFVVDDEFITVFTDQSPFHPEDYLGGDQPSDKGVITIDGVEFQISDTQTLIVSLSTGEQVFPETKRDMNIGVQEGRYGVLTGHVIKKNSIHDQAVFSDKFIQKTCTLHVDEYSRDVLNRTHSAVHLMSIALNDYLKPLWKKSVSAVDDMGNPNFDMMAIEKSSVSCDGGVDIYRIGKSLRKSGFDVEELMSRDEVAISESLTQLINKLIIENSESIVEMIGESINLGSRRFWQTTLQGKVVTIPCGGTHVFKIDDIGSVQISVQLLKDEKSLIISTILK